MNSLCEEDSDLKLAFEAILPIYAGDDLRAGRLHKQIMRDARDEKSQLTETIVALRDRLQEKY